MPDIRPLLTSLFATVFATGAQAHTPVVNDDNLAYSVEVPFEIDDPEHSKAIFSELQGTPQYFRITSDTAFRFYAGITQAKLDGCEIQKTFSFDVLDADMNRIDGQDGAMFDWWPWYEEFGKTWYWIGPELGEDFKGNRTYEAGTYWIRVFNEDNQGKFVLAVGDIEQFGIGTMANLLVNRTMKKIREGWWGENLCEK